MPSCMVLVLSAVQLDLNEAGAAADFLGRDGPTALEGAEAFFPEREAAFTHQPSRGTREVRGGYIPDDVFPRSSEAIEGVLAPRGPVVFRHQELQSDVHDDLPFQLCSLICTKRPVLCNLMRTERPGSWVSWAPTTQPPRKETMS